MAGPGVVRQGDTGQLARSRHPRAARVDREVCIEPDGEGIVITIVGEFDDSTAGLVEVAATTAFGVTDRVVVDLRRAGVATTRSLRSIAAVAAAAQDQVARLVLRGACTTTRQFLALRRLDVAVVFER